MTNWITDRRPTAADADHEGDVYLRDSRDDDFGAYVPWEYVAEGAPWRPLFLRPPAEAASTQPGPEPEARQRRFVSLTRTVQANGSHTLDAIDDDGVAWWMVLGDVPGGDAWHRLCPLPAREVPADA